VTSWTVRIAGSSRWWLGRNDVVVRIGEEVRVDQRAPVRAASAAFVDTEEQARAAGRRRRRGRRGR
jgi:hypothetical protein